MRYVLDASVAVKWVLPERDSANALALCDDYLRGVHSLLAPDTIFLETAHALTRAERRKIIQPGEAIQRLAMVITDGPALHSHVQLLHRATELSSQIKIGVYDCLYLVLAEREQCDVVTADQRLKASGHPR